MQHATTIAVPATGLKAWVELLRPAHWVKNIVVFAGPAAGLKMLSQAAVAEALLAFAAFCLAASATYAINDVVDREADASHPTKRNRPVASGVIRPAAALTAAGVLIVAALALSATLINQTVALIVLMYLGLTLAYSLALKRCVILDVILIALGFVLRAWAGAAAVDVTTSEWLVACMFTLCLFMGFGKRRCEVTMIGNSEEAGLHRATLIRYTPDLLNHLITVSAGITVMTFMLYTMDMVGPAAPFAKQHLFYTLPIVVYGVFRFAMLTETGLFAGPTEIVLKDRVLLGTIIVWTLIAIAIAYEGAWLGGVVKESTLGNEAATSTLISLNEADAYV